RLDGDLDGLDALDDLLVALGPRQEIGAERGQRLGVLAGELPDARADLRDPRGGGPDRVGELRVARAVAERLGEPVAIGHARAPEQRLPTGARGAGALLGLPQRLGLAGLLVAEPPQLGEACAERLEAGAGVGDVAAAGEAEALERV